MYIERVPNHSSPPAVLLRESYREGGRVKKGTLAEDGGPLQMSLFAQTDLAQISHPDFPGERSIACTNPAARGGAGAQARGCALRCIETTDLHVRPIHHRLEERMRAHVTIQAACDLAPFDRPTVPTPPQRKAFDLLALQIPV